MQKMKTSFNLWFI